MKWQGRRASSRVDDRRGRRAPMRGRGRAGGIGIGAIVVILAISYFAGIDPTALLPMLAGGGPATANLDAPGAGGVTGAPADEAGRFVSVVLADTEDTWGRLFAAGGQQYREPTLVLFSDAVQSACGFNSAAVGPFYCPPDQQIYIDLSFFGELERRFGAPGDFAQAYVLAHEVGHHVQNLLGISSEMRRRQQGLGDEGRDALSVRLELQADCFAGVWGYHARDRGLLESGDMEEGLRAAAAIGDDNIQRQSRGYVVPESFTHGSSDQRVEWFSRGLRTGSTEACDTFGAG